MKYTGTGLRRGEVSPGFLWYNKRERLCWSEGGLVLLSYPC